MNRQKAIESIKAFLPNDTEIDSIIECCDLYPVYGTWRKWTDNLGSFIQAHNNKKVVSFTNNPLDQEDHIITDIYFKAHPKTIASISNWAFISFGRDNDDQFNICFIWFLGSDNRLRMVTLRKDEWIKNSPPLICGIDIIRPIIKNTSIEGERADVLNIKGPVPAKILCSWATKWPPNNNIFVEMLRKNKNLTNRVKELC